MAQLKTPDISTKQIKENLKNYQVIIFSLVVLVIVSLVILDIQSLLDSEPDQDVYQAELEKARPITFNEEAIEAIRQLEDSAGPIEIDLPGGRTNPF